MTSFLAYLNTLNPIIQGALGSALFAAAMIVLRWLLRGARSGGRSWFRVVSKQAVAKHILYRDYVRSGEVWKFTWGYLFVFANVLESVVQAFSVLTFFAGVWALLSGTWLALIACFIALSLLLDAVSWLKDWSSETSIGGYDSEVKAELLARFQAKKAQEDGPEKRGG